MAHYFAAQPETALQLSTIKIRFKRQTYDFYSGSDVFSKTRFDPGSALLLASALESKATNVLDLGCGIGISGLLFKRFNPAAKVFLSDINERAVLLAQKNAALHGVRVEMQAGDLFKPWKDKLFDLVLLNPPQKAGRDLNYQMIEESQSHLTTNGILYVVARHNKGGKMLRDKMQEVFGNVQDIGKKGVFRVYVSKKVAG